MLTSYDFFFAVLHRQWKVGDFTWLVKVSMSNLYDPAKEKKKK